MDKNPTKIIEPPGAPSILYVEDDPALLELVSLNLRQAGFRVTVATDAETALLHVQRDPPDLVILDWMLPGASGIEVCRRLRADRNLRRVPVIMLTARAEEQDRLIAFEAGADDYVTKPFSVRELIARIRAVLRRLPRREEDLVLQYDGLTIVTAAQRVMCRGTEVEMGLTEYRLLHFLMSRPERVYTRAQLIDQIWGDQVYIEERTIDVHIRRLRVVLTPSGHDEYVQTVRGSGYRFMRP